jgi:anti-sigma regulatory factor (Ser/Thr protein kinase)
MTVEREFPCKPSSVTAARRFVRELLSEQPRETSELAELMSSELATNCVQHARTAFEISVSVGREIRVEVRDSGAGAPRQLSPAPAQPSGRGLLIVDATAERWGVVDQPNGKTVWFTLPVPEKEPAPRGRRRVSSSCNK